MVHNELRNQELTRHDEQIDRGVERNQALNFDEKSRSITTANHNSSVKRVVSIVYLLTGALELLLLMRIILHLIGANPDNAFANFINGLSGPFVTLFANLIQDPAITSTSFLEVTTILAMLVYAVAAWLIGRLIWLVLSRAR